MSKTLQEHYKDVRAKHPTIPARTAMQWAQIEMKGDGEDAYAPVPADLTAQELYDKGRTFKAEGFSIHATIKQDEGYTSPEELGYGRFVEGYQDSWEEHWLCDEPGAIRRESWERDECRFYVPDYSFNEREKNARDLGASKQSARQEAAEGVKKEMERAEAYGVSWWLVGVEVTVSRAGVELGQSSVWGIEDDAGDDHFREAVYDQMQEAIAEAQEAIKALCSCDD